MQINPTVDDYRVKAKPGFAWDGQDAYLFDIDGTLLRSMDRVHFDSFAAGVKRVTGFEVSLAGIAVHGNTDTAILRAACRQAGISDAVLEEQVEAILEAMRSSFAGRINDLSIRPMPAVEETLRHLAGRGAQLGVATGNLEMIGWMKLEQAGLREWFRFGGFSDRFPDRGELIGHAARKARELAGAAATVCVVGDTPRDIEAARANGLPVIAVATGNFDFDALAACEPEVCATSLEALMTLGRSEA